MSVRRDVGIPAGSAGLLGAGGHPVEGIGAGIAVVVAGQGLNRCPCCDLIDDLKQKRSKSQWLWNEALRLTCGKFSQFLTEE